MSKWTGKYVIGLTGNIGTGKTVVRRMLEHLGAYGIDADALSHRVIAKGGPGFNKVLEVFGQWVLGPDGEIDRKQLGRVVFDNPTALKRLEGIIHPYVVQAIDILIKRSTQSVIAVEAIKLGDLGMDKDCDSVWVTTAPLETQLQRLQEKRKMSRHESLQRIKAQPPQDVRVAAADLVIKNDGSFEETWALVNAAWKKFVPADVSGPETVMVPRKQTSVGVMRVLRGKPRHSDEIAEMMNQVRTGANLARADIMAEFGEKAFLLLQVGESLEGLIAWQVENLVSRTHDIVLDPSVPPEQALPLLFKEMEKASRELQAEAALVFVPTALAGFTEVWSSLGYQQREPASLGVTAWQQAVREAQPANTVLFFKQLRIDRVLRPM